MVLAHYQCQYWNKIKPDRIQTDYPELTDFNIQIE